MPRRKREKRRDNRLIAPSTERKGWKMRAMIAKAKALAIAAAMVVLGVSAVQVDKARSGEPVKVGVLLSLSGPSAPFGIPERDVVKILAEKYNAAGGINGHKLD